MMTDRSTGGYSLFAKLLHWGFVVIFAYGIYKQVDNIDQLEDTALLRFEIIFAAAFFLLLAIRFIYMKRTQTSYLPQQTPMAQKLAAKAVHYGMYACLAGVSVSGLLIGAFYSFGIKSGAIIDLIVSVHELSISVMYWLIGIHVVAAIYHRFLKDGVWSAMVPIFKERG